MHPRSGIVFRSACLVALLLPLTAAGQDLIAPPQPVAPDSPTDAAPSSGVYVHDSALALDRMALAQRLSSLKEWGKAADVYQEIVEKYHDRVVPSHEDESGTVDQYTSVLALVNQRLRDWPPQGLTVYRQRYELTAANLLNSAGNDNLAPLHEAFTGYFVTDAGKAAGIKLIDAYFERGDFPAAAWIAQALLLHPNLDVERPVVLFRAGLASHMSGDDKSAQAALDELKNHFATTIATIGGHDVNLADELTADLSHAAPAHALSSSQIADDSWPMPGGDASRGKISFSTAQAGALLYSFPLPQPDFKNLRLDASQRKTLTDQELPWRRDGMDLDILPVADKGELYFQDNLHIYALNLETAQPLPAWVAAHSSDRGEYTVGDAPNAQVLPVGYQLSLTLTDTAVLAVMGLPDTLAVTYERASAQDGHVVCLDRHDGRENWTFAAHDLPDENLRMLRFGGAPLVAGNNVFLSAFSNKGNGYEDCYVVCLDLATGKYLWSCYIAGAPDAGQTIQNPQTGQINTLLDVPTHMAYASGRVFVSTNEGAVAAVDAYSGNIAWLNIYREPDEAVNPQAMPMGRFWGGFRGGFGGPPMPGASWTPPAPWAANAPIVRDGDLFVLPSDGRYILVYDAGDGHIVKKLRKSDCCMESTDEGIDTSSAVPNALLGVLDGALALDGEQEVRKDLLMLATPNRVCAIKWREYDPDHPTSAIEWISAHDAGEKIRGRPFITADSAYTPTEQKLSRVAVRNGKVLQTYPAAYNAAASDSSQAPGDWPAGEGPGNVLVCGDYIVIAGDRNINVYSAIDLARVRLENEIAAAPADPNARLHYAEVMFRANQATVAAQKLDEAIQMLAAQNAPAARDRAFNDAMEFAVKSGATPAAAAMFDRAAALARWPGQQVSYRMKRAHAYRTAPSPDLGAAINLYQQILADNTLRIVSAGDWTAGANGEAITQAGLVAQSEIDAIIHTPAGAAAYQPFERTADAEFAAALSAKDANRLHRVADDFPNSTIAQRAQLAAADAYEAAGHAQLAAAQLRELYPRLTDPAQRVTVLAAMARNYLNIPGCLDAASGRLSAAAQIDGNAKLTAPLFLPGQSIPAGTTMESAAGILFSLTDQFAQHGQELVEFGFPSSAAKSEYRRQYKHSPDPFASHERKIPDVGKLLTADDQFARYDRIVTWTQGRGVSIFSPTDAGALGTNSQVEGEPQRIAWVNSRKDLLIWTPTQLLLLSGDGARTQWKMALGGMGELDVLSRPVEAANINLIQQMDIRQLGRNRRQNLFPVRERPFVAQPLPSDDNSAKPTSSTDETSPTAEAEFVSDVYPVGDMAILTTSTGRVAAVRMNDGSLLWQMRPSAHPADRVVTTQDFTVIKTTDESTVQLLALDTASGAFLARKIFNAQQDDSPINMALAGDGTFAYTTSDRILIHDLFDAAADPKLTRPKAVADAAPDKPFDSMIRPDQLLIQSGTILAICDGGGTVRGYSAQTGQLREYTQDSRLTPMLLPTGEHTDQTGLRAGDHYFYTWGPGSLAGYNIDHPDSSASWEPHDLSSVGAVRQFIMGKDYLVLLSQPPDQAGQATSWALSAFSRAIVPGKQVETESGRLDYQVQLTDPYGIFAWEAISGGLCYLSGDHVLHLLQGNVNPAPPQ